MTEEYGTIAEQLSAMVTDARERTLELVADLTDAQMLGPQLAIVNPPLWEIGHVAWFQEHWVLRHAGGEPPIRADADALYDSAAVGHDTRWSLPLPSRAETLAYLREVRDRIVDRLRAREPDPARVYFTLLSVFHEDMHTEAFTYTRQTHALPAPDWGMATDNGRRTRDDRQDEVGAAAVGGRRSVVVTPQSAIRTPHSPDVLVPGGPFMPGAAPGSGFVFDNEKWAHPVAVPPFAIAREAATQAEFAAFVEDGGYRRRDLWSAEGWAWRDRASAERPLYWRRGPNGAWERRDFDRWLPLEPRRPIIHCNWYEADAYCRWAGRRLPTEAEWEMAAAAEPTADGRGITGHKRSLPWGDDPPTPERANLDWRSMGCLDVDALSAGDSAFGCRQMIGNVWEWTSDAFGPYPGFVVDPYKEYSAPWFGDHKVLRGGCWSTRARLLRNTWRNFYKPDRRDVWAGFRTCDA